MWTEYFLISRQEFAKFANQPQKVVDDKRLVAVPYSVEVDVEVVVAEEEEAEPRGERVHRHNEQDTDDPALLGWVRVVPGNHRQFCHDICKIARTYFPVPTLKVSIFCLEIF